MAKEPTLSRTVGSFVLAEELNVSSGLGMGQGGGQSGVRIVGGQVNLEKVPEQSGTEGSLWGVLDVSQEQWEGPEGWWGMQLDAMGDAGC